MSAVETGTIRTRIPARLDRLPWSRFHWMVVVGLGTVWILDGLEVTIVGAIASRLTEDGSGIAIDTSQIGTAAAVYVAGACLGALFFGQLTDRFGRKKLFMLTLALYIVATAATGASWTAWYFYICRFFTGAGIGGEYAAINSAIDELIPARVRGRVDLIINGSFWVGSIAGSALAIVLLDTSNLPKDVGWRVAFAIGVVLAFGILLIRRHVPESPRWLFIHGREEEAERIVGGIEEAIEDESGQELAEPEEEMSVRQRETIPFREIGKVAFTLYPKRSILALALFVGQAFIYNGVTFNLGTLFTTFYDVSSSFVPVFVIVYAAANFLGPLTLGRLFDTVGRKPMIAGTYLGSAGVAFAMAPLFSSGSLASPWHLEAFVMGTFFLASAGASAAYLTASEIFPMETRALAIAFFYAIGTAVGGVTGPELFGRLIGSGDRGEVAIAFYIGAAVMALGGIVELLFGVRAEQQALEDIAKPLTVQEAEEGGPGEAREGEGGRGADARVHPQRRKALEAREEAERLEHEQVDVAETRAEAHERWADLHDQRAAGDELLDDGDEEGARESERRAAGAEEPALAAEERVRRAEHLAAAAEVRGEHEQAAQEATAREQAADRQRRREEAEQRIRERIARREQRQRQGLRRYRPGPGAGATFYSPGMLGTAASTRGRGDERALDREIEMIAHALDENGETDRRVLAGLVGARYWGPGRFREALHEAVQEGRVRRVTRRTYGPA